MAGAVQLLVDSDLDTVALVARAVRAICSDRLSEEDLDAIELSLVEATTNVIKHGYNGRSGETLKIGVALHSDRVVIEVVDTAPPMDAAQLEQAGEERFDFDETNIESLPEGGMGLALIRMNMDEVEYVAQKRQNRLRMTKMFAKPSTS
ncbi:ATP-binding protein [Lutibaculum baratangense]|uniref:Putative anti-sigma regulatory factor, serine/threonine protein kinase n=1 Tax=Lutibaculum baratangense AMV1 TaxID=631454 RepID=V4RMB8_9HYPH|nr:ATP-binding protein [Lutibaculum baratangense]ESR27171.1 putative anti-sigma regulatory factor, serine/threonine protein kinase [Lutibaculum baratangense AMV1]